MELTFEKIGDWYISEFEVTSDFNLHIEKEPKGDFYLYQRTSSSGQYDIIEDFGYKKGGDNVIDLDFQALVYPKWIKIKSAVKPLIATITTDGEVNEVVYQAKDIEITSNGTTKVTADTGYTALGSVNVKVNVPSEGGGESSSIEYLDFRNVTDVTDDEIKIGNVIAMFSYHARAIVKEETRIGITSIMVLEAGEAFLYADITACAIDLNAIMMKNAGASKTVREHLEQSLNISILDSIPRLTKEEFYNLNA